MAFERFQTFVSDADQPDIAEATSNPIGEVGGIDAPGNATTTEVLPVGGSIDGVINVLGDQDWVKVTLTAGQSYLFTMTKQVAGSATDPFMRLYAADGTTQITFNDDGAPSNNSSIRYTPTASGTFYLDAQAYNDESTGGYHLTLAAVPPQNPLDSINWGTQLISPAISVYFATTGQTFQDATASRSWTPTEKTAFFQAASTWSNVTNVTFTEAFSPGAATMVVVLDPTIDAVGFMSVPPALPNVGAFDPTGPWWTNANALSPGGEGYQAIIHEIGHALGLAHPHDDGGASQVLEGVTDEFNSYGVTGLNQGIYTVMSYNDGWDLGPSGGPVSYEVGDEASPMAMDIAVVQAKYGAHVSNTGDNVYNLASIGSSQYLTIWDSGGTDAIIDTTSGHNVTIDLRPADLTIGSAGFGGRPSYWSDFNSHGGYMIANGVTIENATSGGGNDTLQGNEVANSLSAGAGSDVLIGRGGDDILNGGGHGSGAADIMYGGSGNDTYFVNDSVSGTQDIVFEGSLFAGSDAGPNDVDTIHSQGTFFWDFYSVGEILYDDTVNAGGDYLVGGKDVTNKQFLGSAGADIISTYGHNSVTDAGAGSDAVIFDLYGLDPNTYRGSNTVIEKPGSGLDYVYNFLSGTDHIDLTAFHYNLTPAQVLGFAVNVDNPGTANDYSFVYLGNAGGVDNFIVFIGLLSSQLHASDFIV